VTAPARLPAPGAALHGGQTPRLTFFCELDAEPLALLFADRVVLEQLLALGARVSLGIRDFSRQRAAVVQRLNQAGIPVIAWQLLADEHGYWYNLGNADRAAERYAAFLRWTQDHDLRWDGVGIDIEPDIREVAQWFANPLRLAAPLLRRLLDHERVRRAGADYSALVERMRADGYPVESYVIPLIRDDRRVGSTLVQRIMGLVDLPTDREVPMLYTSFLRAHGVSALWSYAPEGRAAGLGSTGGGVDVGEIDRIPPLTWDELSRDLRLARRWCDQLYIFSLEGCVRQGFLERLTRFDWDGPAAAPGVWDRRVAGMRTVLHSGLWLATRLDLLLTSLLALSWLLSRRPRRY
jgi:hypothetical protein